jgi:hypothetical protein
MDTSSIIIGVVTLIICAIPFILVSRGNKKRHTEHLKLLSNWISENKLTLDKIETHSDFILGLDSKEKTFVFFKASENNRVEKIRLNNISKVNLVKETVVLNDNNGINSRIKNVLLEFSLKSPSVQSIQFELFNIEKNHQLSGEIQLGQEWVKYLNNSL